ncbi:MAG: phage holin family protein [Variovorax sp.]|nr:MAG: phage holin family protein [Variovorax sp.]
MKLLSLLGLDAPLRRIRIAAGESALAAEDRAQLVRMAWDEEKERLKRMLILVIAVLGLTTVTVALLSVAVVVHFWETPQRTTAAWSVAAVWIVLWIGAVLALLANLRSPSEGVTSARKEIERDWEWAQARWGWGQEDDKPRPPRPATREELLTRIERQRLRVATLQGTAPEARAGASAGTKAVRPAPPPDETATEAALRIARAHPVAAGVAAAAAVVVFKPRRLLRWAAFIAPVLWRMR